VPHPLNPNAQHAKRNTRIGRELSGALVATLAGMALANGGYLPAHGAPELGVVFKHILPLAVPMLLLSADLRRVLRWVGCKYSHPVAVRQRMWACFHAWARLPPHRHTMRNRTTNIPGRQAASCPRFCWAPRARPQAVLSPCCSSR
jgi:hypothetical protein